MACGIRAVFPLQNDGRADRRRMAAPPSLPAILGLLLLTAVVLWIASRAVRRMQISYGSGG